MKGIMKRRWRDPECRNRTGRAISVSMRKLWADPVYVEKQKVAEKSRSAARERLKATRDVAKESDVSDIKASTSQQCRRPYKNGRGHIAQVWRDNKLAEMKAAGVTGCSPHRWHEYKMGRKPLPLGTMINGQPVTDHQSPER